MAPKPRRVASYSIETDQEVLVTFEDGTRQLLRRAELRQNLHPDDYAKLAKAFRLRQAFWRRNLPGGLLLALAGTAAAVGLLATSHPLSQLLPAGSSPSKAPSYRDLQEAHALPVPSASPLASPSASPGSSSAAAAVAAPTHGKPSSQGAMGQLTGALRRMLQ